MSPQPVIREAVDGSRQLSMMRWGLVPAWAKEGDGMINARCEMVNVKPTFRQRRCIIPASGFYEWLRVEGKKVPYYIRMADGSPMPFAGIWAAWHSPERQVLETFAILTSTANPTVSPIHERMPGILPPEAFKLWLDRQVQKADRLMGLLAPCPADRFAAYRVSTSVNSPANDKAECLLSPQVKR